MCAAGLSGGSPAGCEGAGTRHGAQWVGAGTDSGRWHLCPSCGLAPPRPGGGHLTALLVEERRCFERAPAAPPVLPTCSRGRGAGPQRGCPLRGGGKDRRAAGRGGCGLRSRAAVPNGRNTFGSGVPGFCSSSVTGRLRRLFVICIAKDCSVLCVGSFCQQECPESRDGR